MIIFKDELSKINTVRAGFIPYIKIKEKLYFLVGVDRQTGEYSDMGGGLKKDEDVITCAIRELSEETKDLVQISDLGKNIIGIWEKIFKNCILFCEIQNTNLFNTIENDFKESTKKGIEYEEMSALVWLTFDQFIYQIYSKNSKMWSRTRLTLSNCCNFDDNFLKLL